MTDINKLCDELEAKRDASVACEYGAYWSYVEELVKHAQPLIDAARKSVKLREENERMIKRLEIDHVVDMDGNLQPFPAYGADTESLDGISCRDETIDAQDRTIEKLRERIKELEQQVKERGE